MLKAILQWLKRGSLEMKPDKLVIGLGNPGNKYKGTRHNAGYMILSEFAGRHGTGKPRKQFQADIVEAEYKGQKVLLVCPTTYMNLSGQSVEAVVRFYKLTSDQLIVACDDVDLPVGKIRIRETGGSGGQKGLQNIISKLGTNDVTRIRLGIGRPPGTMEMADYVLSPFSKSEQIDVGLAVQKAADALECWLENGTMAAMNRFN